MPILSTVWLLHFLSTLYKEVYLCFLKRKNILPENQKMVREGMNKWLDYVLTAMNDLYNIRVTTLTYKSKNASDYL